MSANIAMPGLVATQHLDDETKSAHFFARWGAALLSCAVQRIPKSQNPLAKIRLIIQSLDSHAQ